MAPATELATFSLIPGAQIEDGSTPAGQVWASTLATVSSQPGFQRARYGREVENQSVLQIFIDWDSFDSHRAFMNAPIYDSFCKHLGTIIDGSLQMLHANLTPHPPTAALGAASPVTQVITCYLEEEKKTEGFEEKFNQFMKVFSEHAEGFKGAAGGWVMEEVEYKGEKGKKAFVGMVGWESEEAQLAFRDTQAHKDGVQLVRGDVLGVEAHLTKFVEF